MVKIIKIEKIDRKIRTWFLSRKKLMQFECEVILKSGTRPRRKVHKILTRNKEKLVMVFKDGFFSSENSDSFVGQQQLVCINIYDDEGIFLNKTSDEHLVVFFEDDT